MQLEEFRASLSGGMPAATWPPLVQAMWWAAKGEWERAHNMAQDIESTDGSWVHAYLHRKEGDDGNAGYWYRQAGRSMVRSSFEDEWDSIVSELLSNA